MSLEDEVEQVFADGRRRSEERITQDTPPDDALAITLTAATDGVVEALRFLARRLEALEQRD